MDGYYHGGKRHQARCVIFTDAASHTQCRARFMADALIKERALHFPSYLLLQNARVAVRVLDAWMSHLIGELSTACQGSHARKGEPSFRMDKDLD
jgi:hypothetical protein